MKLAFDRLLRRKATLECGSELPLSDECSSQKLMRLVSSENEARLRQATLPEIASLGCGRLLPLSKRRQAAALHMDIRFHHRCAGDCNCGGMTNFWELHPVPRDFSGCESEPRRLVATGGRDQRSPQPFSTNNRLIAKFSMEGSCVRATTF